MMMTMDKHAARWMPICGNSFGCSSGNRNESQMMIGKKKIHKNQNEQVCASETDHRSEFTTAVMNVNKMTKALHKHSAIQSGTNREIIRRSVEEAFNGFQNSAPITILKREITPLFDCRC